MVVECCPLVSRTYIIWFWEKINLKLSVKNYLQIFSLYWDLNLFQLSNQSNWTVLVKRTSSIVTTEVYRENNTQRLLRHLYLSRFQYKTSMHNSLIRKRICFASFRSNRRYVIIHNWKKFCQHVYVKSSFFRGSYIQLLTKHGNFPTMPILPLFIFGRRYFCSDSGRENLLAYMKFIYPFVKINH